MAQGSFKAGLTKTSESLTVGQFAPALAQTPGNVGICLSGGGSRALCSGMGQLRALAHLQLNGQSLLSQTKAISTVSGGSWLGVTFEYLISTSDQAYLNEYVADPGQLVPTSAPGHSPAETLDELPAGNIGNAVDSDLFSVPALAVEAYILYKYFQTPPNFLWQALMGFHILAPYGLFLPDETNGMQPASLFSWDQETLQSQVTGPNPELAGETAHRVASGAGNARRPFLICNTAMFLSEPGSLIQSLAPVQATPFMTGIVGSPTGTDANGRTPGGGGVTSFAFSSNPTAVQAAQGDDVTVSQTRQLALVDIVGASSAAYADALQNQLAIWEQDPKQFFDLLIELADDIWDWLKELLGEDDLAEAESFLDAPPQLSTVADLAEIKADLRGLRDLIPRFQYWPVTDAQGYPQTNPTRFADGGSLENSGINGMLSYSDVENVIAFLNASIAMAPGKRGVIDSSGQEIPGTAVIVTDDIPPLFGYQPYDPQKGYVLYGEDPNPLFPQGMNSQVFDSKSFAEVIQGLWQANGGGSNRGSAIYRQTLAVRDNAWFGVKGNRTVKVLWVYPNRDQSWFDLLSPDVQALLAPFSDPTTGDYFPHYGTLDTDLTAIRVNLLAHYTAWMIGNETDAPKIQAMYGA